ncbi:malto-oligosyltrehalose trehalohydrolase [Chryseolinea soli]|nr:malto-oligosyltrehalose trehalohydrolase [Chryseolinea soli]
MMQAVDIDRRRLGVNFTGEGLATVRLWAPKLEEVHIRFNNQTMPLLPEAHGYWTLTTPNLQPGDDYEFITPNGKAIPDPASLCQPYGVHGASRALDLAAFAWTDHKWVNPSQDDYIFYEIHVGTFSPQGNFQGVIEKLPHLKALGITAIELMPVAQFPGTRNWGYDGVFPYAVHTTYGGARGLQELVNRCHTLGIAVVLDVVYNHLGPEGNYFKEFGPYFTSKYKTPWGEAINFDDAHCDDVRRFFIENVLMWFRDFHIDALRLDAVHAIKDFSPVHILKAIRQEVDAFIQNHWCMHYLFVELDLNDPRYIDLVKRGGYGMDAQWADEFHHALRVTTGQERSGYYADFQGVGHLAKAYRDAYVYDGQYSEHRLKCFGIPATQQAGNKFIVFSQNHDQVGNRMHGERTSALVSFRLLKVMAGATILSPYLPLLFMGEEYGEKNPFQYFVHHGDPQLIRHVRRGRREEFAAFHTRGEAPDPQSESTFINSKLQWDRLQEDEHQALFHYYQALIELRKKHPAFHHLDRFALEVFCEKEANVLVLHRWHHSDHAWCAMNFSKSAQPVALVEDQPLLNVLDSGDAHWKGDEPSPSILHAGSFILPPESLVVYTGKYD